MERTRVGCAKNWAASGEAIGEWQPHALRWLPLLAEPIGPVAMEPLRDGSHIVL